MEAKKYLGIVAVCFLCFFGIPIRINNTSVESDEVLFRSFIKKFHKPYNENDTEYLIRFENFKNSLRLIKELNQNRSSNQSALYGLTIFSDLSQNEFINKRLQKTSKQLLERHSENYLQKRYNFSYMKNEIKNKLKPSSERLKRSTSLPVKVDWRDKGVISEIHNQKTCGACWAFSTIETAESMNAMKAGSLVDLSVQEAIDCAKFGNYGCEGGDSCSLLSWLVATKTKITTEKLYPFTYKTGICKIKKPITGVQIQSFTCNAFLDSEDLILKKLAYHGPLVAAVNALNWQYYLGGIVQYHCSGAPEDLNHAVQIVGYDRSGPVPYYIARNSWGTEFGDKGYIYIAIGGNICGLANEVISINVL